MEEEGKEGKLGIWIRGWCVRRGWCFDRDWNFR